MPNVNLADAKARLSELVERAAQGEIQVITRHGRPVAKLVPMERHFEKVSRDWLDAVTKDIPLSDDTVTAMRDGDRY
jgi:prevent-host-death family protein